MIKRKKRPALTDLEVGSFSDIAFLLIIFFILTTQIVRIMGKTIDIPSGSESSSEQKKDDKKQFMIHLTDGNKIIVNDDKTPISLDELKVRLLDQNFPAKEKKEDKFVILEAKNITYDLYFKVVMMIDDAGGTLAILEPETAKDEKKGS